MQNGKAIEARGGKDVEGQSIQVSTKNGNLSQRWRIVYLDSKQAEPKTGFDKRFGFHRNRPFFIVSRLPNRRVIEATGGRNLVIKTKTSNRNAQLWYFDYLTKTIKSKQWSNKSFDIQNAGRSQNLQIWTTNARWFQLFSYNGANIVNERGKVVDVHGAADQENRNVIVWGLHNGKNQQWDIVYADADTEGAFKPGKAFTIVSQMSSKRLLTLQGNNFVISRKTNSPEQLFKYDARTKSIQTYANLSKVITIQNQGRGRNVQSEKSRN